jgi:hypothetical protein
LKAGAEQSGVWKYEFFVYVRAFSWGDRVGNKISDKMMISA